MASFKSKLLMVTKSNIKLKINNTIQTQKIYLKEFNQLTSKIYLSFVLFIVRKVQETNQSKINYQQYLF